MKNKKTNVLKFVTRILAVIYILFITIFAFDSKNLTEFLIHLIPTLIFLICLIISIFKPKIGGILFVLVGIGTIIFFSTYAKITSFILISMVPIIIGLVFYLSKKK
ncbi:MAG TPA: hypothetical protein PK357_00500 [Candidatus Pacearchaeota archaeon]|nr:hypothetical protein [Candidatus Pacearchaeota archaeon]